MVVLTEICVIKFRIFTFRTRLVNTVKLRLSGTLFIRIVNNPEWLGPSTKYFLAVTIVYFVMA